MWLNRLYRRFGQLLINEQLDEFWTAATLQVAFKSFFKSEEFSLSEVPPSMYIIRVSYVKDFLTTARSEFGKTQNGVVSRGRDPARIPRILTLVAILWSR
jgi:hypothetical protein